MGEMYADHQTAQAGSAHTRSPDDGWFDALHLQLHRVSCVAAPPDVEPDDLVQDALVNYLSLADPSAVRDRHAYLTATIVNLAANHRRSWTRRRAAVARLGSSEHSRDDLPSDLADLHALPARERAVLYLHHVEGRPFTDVARLVGCTPAAARKAAERGRNRLARSLSTEERTP